MGPFNVEAGWDKKPKNQCCSTISATYHRWAFATFSPIRYSLFRYFNTSFRYRYSATFPKIAIRYSLSLLLFHQCCGLHHF
jgi:hypothetical protein